MRTSVTGPVIPRMEAMTSARKLLGLLLMAVVAGVLGFLLWQTTAEPPPGATANATGKGAASLALPPGAAEPPPPLPDSGARAALEDATPPANPARDNWWEDPDMLASIQDRIRTRVTDSYFRWANLDAEHQQLIEQIFRDALAKDATGSELLASLRPEEFGGLSPLEEQAIASFVNVAKRNLRVFGADPHGNPQLSKTQLDILVRELDETPLEYPPEYVLRSLGYRFDGSLPEDLGEEIRAVWIRSLLASAPLKAAVNIQISAIGIVDDILGQGVKMPADTVVSPDYAAALEEYRTFGAMYRDQLRRILEARGLLH